MSRTVLLLAALFAVAYTPAVSAQDFSEEALTRPDPYGPPTEVLVDIGFHLISIDERTETFDVEARLELTWLDERLRGFGPVRFSGEGAAELLKTQIWWPYFEITDARSPRQQIALAVEIDSDGWVTYAERFSVVIQQPYDLSEFPWDAHDISFSIESFRLGAGELVFVSRSDFGEVEAEYQGMEGWDVVLAPVQVFNEDEGFSTAVARMSIFRDPTHVVTNIILPLILIILIGSSVFWMNMEKMHLGDRLGVSLTSLLTVVAFDFVAGDGLPTLGYSTSLDAILTLAYVFSALAIAENVRVSVLQGTSRAEKAARLDRLFRFGYPPAFVLLVVFIWLGSGS